MQEFTGHGIRFRYPESWSIIDESTDEKSTITVQSDGTAFWTVAVFAEAPPPERLVESAVSAYREDYTELDVYPLQQKTGAHGSVVARDLEFVCLELIAAAHVEAFESGGNTVLVLFQASDAELASRRHVLDAMTASLQVTAGNETLWPEDLFGE